MRKLRWALLAVAAGAMVLVADGCTGFGHRASGARRARMERSPQYRDGRFRNPQPLDNHLWQAASGAWSSSPDKEPSLPIPTVTPSHLAGPPATGLRITWLGHASILIEIDGHRVLTDPIWSERASPWSWIGPKRWYAPPIALADLPSLDAVVISHDHYDHLDQRTMSAMKDWKTTFVVPLGVGAHLAYWGVPESHIVELDWWERARVRGLQIVCTPARHASGRVLFDTDATLWAGYAFVGDAHRAWFSGDTGLFPALADIGARLGPFDVTLIETGQYDPAWPDWHIGPEQAVRAHQLLRGRLMLPVHWGLFSLAYHSWIEPAERAIAAADAAHVPIVVPRPGQGVEPDAPPPRERWWPPSPRLQPASARGSR